MQLDEEFHAHHLHLLGEEATTRLASSKVLICGFGGLGAEIAKCVLLSGVQHVVIQDVKRVSRSDMGTHFFITESDLGCNRAITCHQRLRALAPGAKIGVHIHPITTDYLERNSVDVVVITDSCESFENNQLTMDNFMEHCHRTNIRVILVDARGLFGRIFVDLGPHFYINDTSESARTVGSIANITNEENAIITCTNNPWILGLVVNDKISFKNTPGMLGDLDGPVPIRVTEALSPTSFRTDMDTRKLPSFPRDLKDNGLVLKAISSNKTLCYKSFGESLMEPKLLVTDETKQDQTDTLFIAFRALDEFVSKRDGRLPRFWHQEDAKSMLKYALRYSSKYVMTLDKQLMALFSFISAGTLCPINGVVGSIAAAEVIKACTGLFKPIYQWAFFDAIECLSSESIDNISPEGILIHPRDSYKPSGSRYDAQISIFGEQFQNKLGNLNCLLLGGAGHLGHEILKNFAMMGISTTGGGKTHIVDGGHIQKSTLNREFLFRQHNIGQLKADIAVTAAIRLNNHFNVSSQRHFGSNTNRKCVDEEFFSTFDCIIPSTEFDTLSSGLAQQCIDNGVPLLYNEISGTTANVVVLLPAATSNVWHTATEFKEENFPGYKSNETDRDLTNSQHATTLFEWAAKLFDKLFDEPIGYAHQYLVDPNFVEKTRELPPNDAINILDNVKLALVDDISSDFGDCVDWACRIWQKYLNRDDIYDDDDVSHDSTPKQIQQSETPTSLAICAFQDDEDLHDFIFYAANIRAHIYGLQSCTDREVIKEIANSIVLNPTGTPPILHQKSDEDLVQDTDAAHRQLHQLIECIPEPRLLATSDILHITPIHFKQNDTLHIGFVHATANCRAKKVNTPPISVNIVKMLAEGVKPSIAPLSPLVAGLLSIELVKLAQDKRPTKVEKFRNGNIRLSIPLVKLSQPKQYQNPAEVEDDNPN